MKKDKIKKNKKNKKLIIIEIGTDDKPIILDMNTGIRICNNDMDSKK